MNGKKRNVWLSAVMVCLLSALSGCQENPNGDVVANKNEGVLEAAIQENSDGGENEDRAEHYTDSFTIDGGDITVNVDAVVTAVDKDLPVVRVTPHEITAQEVKLWTDVLFEGNTAFEPIATKAEIETRILQLKGRLEDRADMEADYGSSEVDEVMDDYRDMIAALEADYQRAPDRKPECDWTFHPYEYYSEMTSRWNDYESEKLNRTYLLEAAADNVNGHSVTVYAENRSAEDYMLHDISFYYSDEKTMTDIPYKEISQEAAEDIASEALTALGLGEDWSLWETNVFTLEDEEENPQEHVYFLKYTPVYEGVRTLLGPMIDLQSEDLYAANLEYGSLEVYVINGILRSVWLTTPMDVVSVENANVKTMSLDEVYQSFVNYMQVKYTKYNLIDMSDPRAEEYVPQICVTNIIQGLFRIKIKDSSNEFRMVPVWAFCGTVDGIGDGGVTRYFAVINAIDGSVINTNLGY